MKNLREFEHNGKTIQIVVVDTTAGPVGGYKVWAIYAESGREVNGFVYGVNKITRAAAQSQDNFDLIKLAADLAQFDVESDQWGLLVKAFKS